MSALNTKQMTVEEIRDHIISNHKIDKDTLLKIKGKSNLVNFLSSLEQSDGVKDTIGLVDCPAGESGEEGVDGIDIEEAVNTIDSDDVDEFEVTFANEQEQENVEGKEAPCKSDPNWTEYVLSQLTDKEKDKEYPKADGLRRLVEKLISPIRAIQTTVIQPPQQDNLMTSTVKTTIILENGQQYDACTDVQKDHLEHPFDRHISAIAETRAEGRAYRKILRLQNIVTKEEIVAESGLNGTQMTKTQIQFLDVMCNNTRLNINVKKLFDLIFGDKKLEDVKQYLSDDVAKVCNAVSEYQQDMDKIPSDIKGYSSSWKE